MQEKVNVYFQTGHWTETAKRDKPKIHSTTLTPSRLFVAHFSESELFVLLSTYCLIVCVCQSSYKLSPIFLPFHRPSY
jgi:hypothetical protein